eukprot:363399_1
MSLQTETPPKSNSNMELDTDSDAVHEDTSQKTGSIDAKNKDTVHDGTPPTEPESDSKMDVDTSTDAKNTDTLYDAISPTERNSKMDVDTPIGAKHTDTPTDIAVSKTGTTDISYEKESKPANGDPPADCKSDDHCVMNGSSKSIEVDVQNTQITLRGLMAFYNNVNKRIESLSVTPPDPLYDRYLSTELSCCIQMLNMLQPAQYQEAIYHTNTTALKLCHWRNAAYFYLIRFTIKQCIDSNYTVPVVIDNKLMDPTFECVFEDSNHRLKDVLNAYKALDSTSEQNARRKLADACADTDIDKDDFNNPVSEDQLRISTPSKDLIRIAKNQCELPPTKRYRLYLVTANQPTKAYIQLESLCDEQFQMKSVAQETNLFYLDLDIAWQLISYRGARKVVVRFSYVMQDAQPRIVESREFNETEKCIFVMEDGNASETFEFNDLTIVQHLLEHIVDYSSYEFAKKALISLNSAIHPKQDALREIWKQNIKLLEFKCGSLQLNNVHRLQALMTVDIGTVYSMDVYRIIRHVLDGLHMLSDNDLREKIATSIYESFGRMVMSYFVSSTHLEEKEVRTRKLFALYSIYNYFQYFEGIYNNHSQLLSKSCNWDATKIQAEFVEILNSIEMPPTSDVQKLMKDILEKLETDLSFRCLGYQSAVCLEGDITTFCYNEFTRGHTEFAQDLIYKMMKLIASNCNPCLAACIMDDIWKTKSEFIFPIVSTDYRLWIKLFTPPTRQYIQHNDELIQRFNHFVKESILKFNANDTVELRALFGVLCEANLPMFNAVDPGLTVLKNHNLWSPESPAAAMKENLDIVLHLFTFIRYGTDDGDNIEQKLIQFIQMLLQNDSIRNHILSVYHSEAQTCTTMSGIIKSAILLSLNQPQLDSERCLRYLPCAEFYKLDMDTFISKLITGNQPAGSWTNEQIKRMQTLYQQHCIGNDDVRVSRTWNCIFDALFSNHVAQDREVHHLQHLALCLLTAKWIPFAKAHRNTLDALNKWADVVRTQLCTLQTHVQSKQVSMSTMDLFYQNQGDLTDLIRFVSEMDASCCAKLNENIGEMIKQYKKWNCYRKQIQFPIYKVEFPEIKEFRNQISDEFRTILCNWDTTSYQVVSARSEWSMWFLVWSLAQRLQTAIQQNIEENERYKQLQDKHNKAKHHHNELKAKYDALLLQHEPEHEYKATEFSDGTKGLRNIGNTCFMNSILQSLSHIPRLAQYFLNTDLTHLDIPLCQAFGGILSDMWFNRDEESSLHCFKSEMAKIASIYGGYNPQDPRELLDYLLNALHDKLNTGRTGAYNKDANKIDMSGLDDSMASTISWQVFSDQNKSIITDLFYGQMKSTTKCGDPKCGYVTVIFEPFRVLHVSTAINKRNRKLYDCIDDCFAPKQIYDSLWYCKKCKKKTYGAIDQTNIYKYPSILVIHLKKVEMQNINKQPKIEYPVKQPLDFSRYCTTKKQNIKYDLCAVSTLSGNHCTAYAKNDKNKWFWFNDSSVKKVRNVVVQNAYLLFYQRRC